MSKPLPASAEFEIDGRKIGPGHPPYVIAEMSGNHNGDLDRALRLIDAAHRAGADAIKLQTYRADTITIDHDGPGFRIDGGLWAGKTLYELYQWAHTPWEWHAALFAHARSLGIACFSSPFDTTAIELLRSLNAPAYKIASFELIDLPLIRFAAASGKPLILSTGLGEFGEIAEAAATVRAEGVPFALLHCTSGYPTPAAEADLATIPHLASSFGIPIGLSDHTLGTAVATAAVALGACIIEKHMTLARADGGPDAAFSLEPAEMARLVEDVRTAWDAIGTAGYDVKPSEGAGRDFRRSLYAVADIAAGTSFDPSNVRSIRPGGGLAPKFLPLVMTRRAARDIRRGEPLGWDMVGV
jgi:N-acetylneuraminate synthase